MKIHSVFDSDEVIYESNVGTMVDLVEEAVREGVSLSQANLFGTDLLGADLEGANLRGANLEGMELSFANLKGSELLRADLSRTELFAANLSEANLGEIDLSGANLSGANLKGIKNYSDSHCIFQELIKRQKCSTFTDFQWAIIGKICIHTLCWDTIKHKFSKNSMIKIFKILAGKSWDEYLIKYESML